MTDKQPEALRQAAWLKKEGASCQRHYDLGVLIERQHAELETLTLYKSLADEYGLSIFKDLKDLTTEIENLRAKLKTHEDFGDAGSDVQLLRMGYAAARLEIESLKSQSAAQRSGAAYAALSDAEIDRIVPALEPVSEDFPVEWALWKDRGRIRNELRTSHGQAPAQPVATAGGSLARIIEEKIAAMTPSEASAFMAARAELAASGNDQAAPDMRDPYGGAREDLAIWRKRALEAEALNRKFATSVNGPTFMGEPADSDGALMAREIHESQDDSLLLCASDLQHSAIYDNHVEMQSCMRAVAARIAALVHAAPKAEPAAPAAVEGPSDLRTRCEEILAWRKTGVLPGEALRTLAREKYGDEYDAIQRAERDTETEALNFVVAAPTTQPAPQQEPSPTAGMSIAQRILHVGGRNSAAGYVEFGSIQAVAALVRQVLRDLPAPQQDAQEPVAWQYRSTGEGGAWWECAKELANRRAAHPEKWEVRCLYTAPQTSPAAQTTTGVQWQCGPQVSGFTGPSDDVVMNRTRDLASSGRWPSDWIDAYRRGYADAAPTPQQAPQQEAQEPFAWHVCSVNSDGSLSLEHAAAWEEAAHEHINDAITEHDIEGAGSWVVRPAYHAPQPVERKPLTDEQWQRIADLTNSILTRATKDEIERVIGIKGGQNADT